MRERERESERMEWVTVEANAEGITTYRHNQVNVFFLFNMRKLKLMKLN